MKAKNIQLPRGGMKLLLSQKLRNRVQESCHSSKVCFDFVLDTCTS